MIITLDLFANSHSPVWHALHAYCILP
uniref:Uncharacterized protein n=1 Tax=Anguilla anguilla TaxID=7936 RepID=A0A0E9VHC5_ANGAN